MSAIRHPGKIDENTTLLDLNMGGLRGLTGVYLIQGDRKCLIDAGMPAEAPRLVKLLTELGAFPPDLIILTHPHFDHAQGVPSLREAATRRGKQIEVLAGHEAVPLLADATFNDIFKNGPYQSIQDVTAVRDGEAIDLGGLILRIYAVPGHCRGHIAIFDEKNGNLFVGDTLGYHMNDGLLMPPIMPPTWDLEAFLASVNTLKQIPFQKLCLAHFGYLYGSEARSFLDEAVETCQTWWRWCEQHADRLDDADYLLRAMREELNPPVPKYELASFKLKLTLGLLTGVNTILGRKTAFLDKLYFAGSLEGLAQGYRMYTASQ